MITKAEKNSFSASLWGSVKNVMGLAGYCASQVIQLLEYVVNIMSPDSDAITFFVGKDLLMWISLLAYSTVLLCTHIRGE